MKQVHSLSSLTRAIFMYNVALFDGIDLFISKLLFKIAIYLANNKKTNLQNHLQFRKTIEEIGQR